MQRQSEAYIVATALNISSSMINHIGHYIQFTVDIRDVSRSTGESSVWCREWIYCTERHVGQMSAGFHSSVGARTHRRNRELWIDDSTLTPLLCPHAQLTQLTQLTPTDQQSIWLLLVNKSRPRQRIPPHLLSLFKMSESESWTTNSSRRRVKKQSFSRKTRLSGPSEQQHTPRLGSVSFPDYSRADQMNAVSGNKEEEPMANQISFPTPHYGQ